MEGEGLDLLFQDPSHQGQAPALDPAEGVLATAWLGILGGSRCVLTLHRLCLPREHPCPLSELSTAGPRQVRVR